VRALERRGASTFVGAMGGAMFLNYFFLILCSTSILRKKWWKWDGCTKSMFYLLTTT